MESTDRQFRIAIIGAHGTGKTTLANDLVKAMSRQGCNATVAPEPIRTVARGNESDHAYFLKLLEYHFKRLEGASPITVFDRTLVDFIVYLETESVPVPEIISLARTLLPVYLNQIDVIIKTEIEFKIESDGRRPESPGFQQHIDAAVNTLAGVGNKTVTSVRGSREQRLQQVLDLLLSEQNLNDKQP